MHAIEYNRSTIPRDAVRDIQRTVGAGVDGIWGPETIGAIRDWQRDHGLRPDGKVGDLTWAALTAPRPPLPERNPGKLVVAGMSLDPPCDVNVRNWFDANVKSFKSRGRVGRKVTEIVVHESVTRSVAATERVLRRRGLGVHLMIGPDGNVTQYNDLAYARLKHAGQGHNGPSVGLELVNPYYPKYLKDDLPWSNTIDAKWAHDDKYVLPTPAQAETCARMISWLVDCEELDIPLEWNGVRAHARMSMRSLRDQDPEPGIWAHQYFAHADGSWPVLYTWLRMEADLPPEEAYLTAMRLAATQSKTIDLIY